MNAHEGSPPEGGEARRGRPTPRTAGGGRPTPESLTALTVGRLPGLLGFRVTAIGTGTLSAELDVRPRLLAPNGYLHAATVVALADTACGMGCRVELPEGALGFTTLELKTSFLSTAREGTVAVEAVLVHGGRSTQVWDAVVTAGADHRIALFRCTQLILWPR